MINRISVEKNYSFKSMDWTIKILGTIQKNAKKIPKVFEPAIIKLWVPAYFTVQYLLVIYANKI